MEQLTLKLGKNRPTHDLRTLRLGHYLAADLPAPPAVVDWSVGVRRWPMYLNDRYGDCTCAAVGHMIETWTASVKAPRVPTDAVVLALYRHFTEPGPDAGCSMLDVLRYWRSHGIAGDRIAAFALLKRRSSLQLRQAIALFGGCYIGLELPDFAVAAPDLSRVQWGIRPGPFTEHTAPNPDNGHCVNAVGYDETTLHVVTWGAIKGMSWDFYTAYCDEAYAVLSPDFMAHGTTPAGVNLAQLQEDLAAIGGQQAA